MSAKGQNKEFIFSSALGLSGQVYQLVCSFSHLWMSVLQYYMVQVFVLRFEVKTAPPDENLLKDYRSTLWETLWISLP